MGNIATEASLGAISIEAKQSITLKVGQSTITIDPVGVTIDAPTITLKAKLSVQIDTLMLEEKGSAMVVVKGGIVQIN
jgi:type VI secretion system secreted protein VgrG